MIRYSKRVQRLEMLVRQYREMIEKLREYVEALERWHQEIDIPDGWVHRGDTPQVQRAYEGEGTPYR